MLIIHLKTVHLERWETLDLKDFSKVKLFFVYVFFFFCLFKQTFTSTEICWIHYKNLIGPTRRYKKTSPHPPSLTPLENYTLTDNSDELI